MTDTEKKTATPSNRGQGRKSLSGAGTTATFNFRAPPDMIGHIKKMGGSDWLRELVKKNM
jgi:hypothetical protein